jgi:arylsulfatase A-like enzyme
MSLNSQPNILLITSDQQHYSALGIDNPRIKTPALDHLCREGTRFTRAYCANPLCSPSRASIITGMYPSQHGCWTVGVKLPEDVPTLGQYLGRAGYATGLVGKAHFQPLASQPGYESLEAHPTLRDLEFWRGFHGPWYGFEHIEVSRNHADEGVVGQHYAIWMEEQGLKNWQDYFRFTDESNRRYGAWELPEAYHYTTWTAERAIAFIQKSKLEKRPFFLWASFHDPHPPYLVPEPWASMYDPEDMIPGRLEPGEHSKNPPHFAKTQEEDPDFGSWHEPFYVHGCESHLHSEAELKRNMAIYYGMTSLLDKYIGHILSELEGQGLSENTLVVFTCDHGHFLGQHGLIAKGPFHYEDLLRVPFIVRWPGHVKENQTSEALQSLVDLTPTFLAAVLEKIPGVVQGVNQLEVWQGEREKARDHILCENRNNPVTPNLRTYVDERYKLTLYSDSPDGELFDLQEDPFERNNLWYDVKAASLKQELFLKFLQGIMKTEPTRFPRIAMA